MVPCKSKVAALSESENEVVVTSAPVVLYSVIVANASDTAMAIAGVYNGAVTTGYADFCVAPGASVVWTGCLALPKGLAMACEAGGVRMTVMYV